MALGCFALICSMLALCLFELRRVVLFGFVVVALLCFAAVVCSVVNYVRCGVFLCFGLFHVAVIALFSLVPHPSGWGC